MAIGVGASKGTPDLHGKKRRGTWTGRRSTVVAGGRRPSTVVAGCRSRSTVITGGRRRSTVIAALSLPLLAVAIGLSMLAYFGWRYAEQTIFINDHSIPAYNPTAYSSHSLKLWPVTPAIGQRIGTLTIPSLNLQAPIVQGTGWNQLGEGIGHYASSALPGQGGNVFIAGHRDTVFTQLRNLKKGALIIFATPYGDFVYEATSFQIVKQSDTSVLDPTHYETLTMMTCYPFFFFGFAPDRYIVHCKLVSEPKAVATAGGQ